jgi:hypothetical protein
VVFATFCAVAFPGEWRTLQYRIQESGARGIPRNERAKEKTKRNPLIARGRFAQAFSKIAAPQ